MGDLLVGGWWGVGGGLTVVTTCVRAARGDFVCSLVCACAVPRARLISTWQGHDMAEFVNAGEFPDGNHAFQQVILRCLLWLAKLI